MTDAKKIMDLVTEGWVPVPTEHGHTWVNRESPLGLVLMESGHTHIQFFAGTGPGAGFAGTYSGDLREVLRDAYSELEAYIRQQELEDQYWRAMEQRSDRV